MPSSGAAQADSSRRSPVRRADHDRDSVTVIPHSAFAVGGLHRFLLGNTYRPLWTKPIRIRVADLGGVEGGLTAVKRSSADASRPFMFQAANGSTFGFRALVKDATLDWPPKLRTAAARKLAQDQISGTVPGGPLAIEVLQHAAGLIHPDVQLVVLPDDPRLGEWRADYAGRPGILEQRLHGSDENPEEVKGARELLDSKDLFERLRTDGASRVDARAYLTARLVDLLIGDWDRHEGQWTWARFDDAAGHRWVPIPTDRDWAFTRLDGLLWSLARFAEPKFTKFDSRFSGLGGLTKRSTAVDRRLLVSLDRAAWDSVTKRLVSRLNDKVIERAMAALPPGYDRNVVAWLTEALQHRRDELPSIANAFYRQLADVVEIWATEGADRIELAQARDSSLTLTVERMAGQSRWRRHFLPAETQEIRVYTLGGADRVTGASTEAIRIRIVDDGGGPLSIATSITASVYDSTRTFNPPGKPHSPEAMLRDWGATLGIAPWLDYWTNVGLVLGGGPMLTRYGFRRAPFASQLAVRAAYATGITGINVDFRGDFRFESPGRRLLLRGTAFSSDAVRYFGLGNETKPVEPVPFYVVRRNSYSFEPKLSLGMKGKTEFSIGGFVRNSDTDQRRQTLAAAERPYGFGNFTEVGASAGWELDLRDNPGYPNLGLRVQLNGEFFPAIADVAASFAVFEGTIAGFATAGFLPGRPTLALRAGASKDWGDSPFFEAPSLGGRHSLRGFLPGRFIGDAALYGSGELRLDLGASPVIPGEWGIFGLGDLGQVYLDGEASSTWHRGWGAGLWLAIVERKNTVTFTYARSGEAARIYATFGFHF
ncbi:MAG TPA: BamA/TamA family outer membrane protein [Gemmatimonadales bacterium]|nr:BamA/TamA family outer membrane protein [Gemmatimonadales bacterium]